MGTDVHTFQYPLSAMKGKQITKVGNPLSQAAVDSKVLMAEWVTLVTRVGPPCRC
jgi:hypothetical protein